MAPCEARVLPSGLIATGSGPGTKPVVTLFDASTGAAINQFQAYPGRDRGGVAVAVGDVDGDGVPDIVTANGPGSRTMVRVLRGTDGALLSQFAVGPPGYKGGASIALGDVNGDGRNDVIVGLSRGPGTIAAYQASDGTILRTFGADRGGARVATGDLDRDGRADVVAVAAAGRPVVRAYSGATGQALAGFGSGLPKSLPRGSAVAVGDVDGDGRADLIVANPVGGRQPGARVRVFAGPTGAVLANFVAPGRPFAAGARVAAVDSGGDLVDDIALTPARGGASLVFDMAGLRQENQSPFTAAFAPGPIAPAAGPLLTAPRVAARVFAGPGASLAAASSANEQVPAAGARLAGASAGTTAGLTPLARLALFDPATNQFVPIAADDPRLAGKDVYVIAHGWAPGYLPWVQAAAATGQTLTWWDTFPTQDGNLVGLSGGLGPASSFLLDGVTADDSYLGDPTVVSATGLARSLAASDPQAAVLAFSWIDDSATSSTYVGNIPEDASLSEAKTTLDGLRLASGLRQALGNNFAGRLQLIGHSHGSKVVTVAAGALEGAPDPIRVDQLTLLDSPEASDTDTGFAIAKEGAANNNWYALDALDTNRAGSGTFVDNYISAFDTTYAGITYPGSTGNLGDVVDVTLDPLPYDFPPDVGGQHTYSAAWYAGSAESTVDGGQTVGRLWSPLLAGNSGPDAPPADLASGYSQSWTYYEYYEGEDQYALATNPTPATPIVFNPIALAPAPTAPGVTVTNLPAGATVVLTQAGGLAQSYTGGFTTAATTSTGIRGITFEYAFPDANPGDLLTITVDGAPAFVMDASLAGSTPRPGTLSLGDYETGVPHTLGFYLVSDQANSSSRAVISDLQQFAY